MPRRADRVPVPPGAQALAMALMIARHGNLEPPLDAPCQVCLADAVGMHAWLDDRGWHVLRGGPGGQEATTSRPPGGPAGA